MTNPKDKLGKSKFPMSYVPASVLAEVGIAMHEGAIKYGAYNFRNVEVSSSVYYNATMRHLMTWWEGEDIDPESGMNHITKAITSLIVLRDGFNSNTIKDDRPTPMYGDWVNDVNELNEQLIKRYEL